VRSYCYNSEERGSSRGGSRGKPRYITTVAPTSIDQIRSPSTSSKIVELFNSPQAISTVVAESLIDRRTIDITSVSSPILEEPSQTTLEDVTPIPHVVESPIAVTKVEDTRHKSLILSPATKKKSIETNSHEKERSSDEHQSHQGSLHVEKIKIDYEAKLKVVKLKEAELEKRLSDIDSLIEKRVREAVLTDRVATIANIHAQSLSEGSVLE